MARWIPLFTLFDDIRTFSVRVPAARPCTALFLSSPQDPPADFFASVVQHLLHQERRVSVFTRLNVLLCQSIGKIPISPLRNRYGDRRASHLTGSPRCSACKSVPGLNLYLFPLAGFQSCGFFFSGFLFSYFLLGRGGTSWFTTCVCTFFFSL